MRPDRKSVLLALVCAFTAAPALAQRGQSPLCQELWIARNAILDAAGHCFASPLGQAVFDDADCTGTNPPLDPEQGARVAALTRLEADWGCAIDPQIAVASGALPDIAPAGPRLLDLPDRSGEESTCLGWNGAPLPLYAMRDPGSARTGTIAPGDTILLSAVPVAGWEFVDVPGGDGLGWLDWSTVDLALCTQLAG